MHPTPQAGDRWQHPFIGQEATVTITGRSDCTTGSCWEGVDADGHEWRHVNGDGWRLVQRANPTKEN